MMIYVIVAICIFVFLVGYIIDHDRKYEKGLRTSPMAEDGGELFAMVLISLFVSFCWLYVILVVILFLVVNVLYELFVFGNLNKTKKFFKGLGSDLTE